MSRNIALLRGINVGGHRKVPMAQLRTLCAEIGWSDVETYIQSGNIVFSAAGRPQELERALERAIEACFGFPVDVIVRTAGQWRSYCSANPFREEGSRAANLLLLYVGKQAASEADVSALAARAAPEEKVARTGDAIWIWFGNGSGRSRIGSGPARPIWTGRNLRTVQLLERML